MKLVVFDLDGTLTRTSHVDSECYAQALLEIAGIRDPRTDWSSYEHATDTGIVDEIFRERFGRSPEEMETRKICERMLQLFAARCAADGSEFLEVPGAGSLLTRLLNEGTWGVALATGAWRRSAEFKIQHSRLPLGDLPSAFAEDGPSREGIVRAAIERALRHHGQARFERVVSVGDGLWDLITAQNLALPFIGVAEDGAAKVLRDNGASHVVGNYLDVEQCLRFLDQAHIPNPTPTGASPRSPRSSG